jgi:ubiquinone biosynthesis protein
MPDALLTARRLATLAWALIRFGLPLLGRRIVRPRRGDPELPVRFRRALEEMGLTYLKLGQYLAMRFDILPAEVCRELGRLFDEVPPMPFETSRAVVEQELAGPLEQRFARFDSQPLAAASVAQVHRAATLDGEEVAVKVQRPGITRVFETDIRILRAITRAADALQLLGRLSVTEMLDEFARWTMRETDFLQEARTAERVGANPPPYEVEPDVRWDLTTARVLTLEFIEGVTLAQIIRVIERDGEQAAVEQIPGLDVELVLHHLSFASLRQIFVTGLFHGDPHPGNILVLSDNRVAFVDFGIFGELSRYDREILGAQIEQLAIGNIDESLRAYAKQLSLTPESDPRAFRREARGVLREWYELSLRTDSPTAERHLGRYIGRMIDISRRHRLLYDMSFLLYWRALNALDSTALRMSSSFDLMRELRSFFERLRPGLAARLADLTLDEHTWSIVRSLVMDAPDRMRFALDGLSDGRFEGTVAVSERESERRVRDGGARRLAGALAAVSALVLCVALAALVGARA